MNTQIRISMRKAILKGKIFEEWWKSEGEEWVKAICSDKDIAKVHYVTIQNETDSPKLNEFKTVIVTDRNGWPPEHREFVLHNDGESAVKHGTTTLGKGNFRLVPWSKFKNSAIHERMQFSIKAYNRLFKFRKPKTTTTK